MLQGYVVDQARLEAVRIYKTIDASVSVANMDPRLVLHVWGDWFTRLHGLYLDYTGWYNETGTVPMTSWYI